MPHHLHGLHRSTTASVCEYFFSFIISSFLHAEKDPSTAKSLSKHCIERLAQPSTQLEKNSKQPDGFKTCKTRVYSSSNPGMVSEISATSAHVFFSFSVCCGLLLHMWNNENTSPLLRDKGPTTSSATYNAD